MRHSAVRFDPIAPRSRFYHGPFGRLFPNLPPWSPEGVQPDTIENHFLEFVKNNMVDTQNEAPDSDGTIPAGYTYFGQFIDHDLTLDVTPLSQSEVDPDRLHNFRTPRLDLDCVYGRGPDDQPYLYEHEESSLNFTGKLLVGEKISGSNFPDLPRNSEGRALIGDMRNDENAIVAQLQLAFILAHNTLVDRAKEDAPDGSTAFNRARRTLCWLYQWVVWNDFVKRVTQSSVYNIALTKSLRPDNLGEEWQLGLQDIFNWKDQPFMPVEFSVAAYRFGHSMVRKSYQTNISDVAGLGKFISLFGQPEDEDDEDDLRGLRPLDKRRLVQWDWFLKMETSSDPFPQHARKIDTKLSKALMHLPETSSNIASVLAARNLVRGVRMELPSGPDVARKLGLNPIGLEASEPQSLWYYILKEAEKEGNGNKLGSLGSLILCAVFAGLLKGDATSWVNMEPGWTPDRDPLLKDDDRKDGQDGEWTLASIIRLSGLPVSADDTAKGSNG